MIKRLVLPLVLGCLIIIILISLTRKEDVFPLTAAEALEEIGNIERIIKPDQLTSFQSGKTIVLVDLRPRDKFSEYHLDSAVNFPSAEMDVRSIHEFFEKPANYLLYADETSSACKNLVLFTQLGIKNVWVLDSLVQFSGTFVPGSLNN